MDLCAYFIHLHSVSSQHNLACPLKLVQLAMPYTLQPYSNTFMLINSLQPHKCYFCAMFSNRNVYDA